MTTITALPPRSFLQQMQLFNLETPAQTESPICLLKSSFPKIALTLHYIIKIRLFFYPLRSRRTVEMKTNSRSGQESNQDPRSPMPGWPHSDAQFSFPDNWDLGLLPGNFPLFIYMVDDSPLTSSHPHASLPEAFQSAIVVCVSCSNERLVLQVPQVIFCSARNFRCRMGSDRLGYSCFEIN